MVDPGLYLARMTQIPTIFDFCTYKHARRATFWCYAKYPSYQQMCKFDYLQSLHPLCFPHSYTNTGLHEMISWNSHHGNRTEQVSCWYIVSRHCMDSHKRWHLYSVTYSRFYKCPFLLFLFK